MDGVRGENWQGCVKMVLYFVMFESSPLLWVDEVMTRLVEGNTQDISVERFYSCIVLALESTVQLSTLLPGFRPSEAATREYLRALKKAIEDRHDIARLQNEP